MSLSMPMRLRQSSSSALDTASSPGMPLSEMTLSSTGVKAPVYCPGCGAPSQTIDSTSPGFYNSRRVEGRSRARGRPEEDQAYEAALKTGLLGAESVEQKTASPSSPKPPVCNRCHYLRHQSMGTSIVHPSTQSIRQMIEESPHKRNHIYHVVDAADFPLSLIPNLTRALDLPDLRTQNRRSKSLRFDHGRVAEISFIITRSDLLAPKKEQVDQMMTYLKEVLREALGRMGKNARLGNVWCVSARRGWWTRPLKEDVWNLRGAGWMVGKVNVGKSALFAAVFPKGRGQSGNTLDLEVDRLRDVKADLQRTAVANDSPAPTGSEKIFASDCAGNPVAMRDPQTVSTSRPLTMSEEFLDDGEDGGLLPPAQTETAFPTMPLVSGLPGTTASPIRIPFGDGKGELIDLPGIYRGSLDEHVRPEHRKSLIMRTRVKADQFTIKPGQSLLLGGLVRITPKTDELVFLANPFVPLEPHVTSNEKAVGIQTGVAPDGQPYSGTVSTILTDEAKLQIQSAGTFRLEWDVTKNRAGPVTDKSAGKQKAANLPFAIFSADLLIESIGWVELTCQVRRPRQGDALAGFDDHVQHADSMSVPEVEVFTPGGKSVDVRKPMGAWLLGGLRKEAKHRRKTRGRMSISFHRRKEGGARGGAGWKDQDSGSFPGGDQG